MTLWIPVALIAGLALLWLLRPLLAPGDRAMGRAAGDRRVYRAQLAEVERDLARGVLTPAEAAGARAEIGRRLLAADAAAAAEAGPAPAPRAARTALALLLLAAPAAGLLLYLATGSPGTPDLALAERRDLRPLQAEAEAMLREAGVPPAPEVRPETEEATALVARLAAALADRPTDLRGHRLLAGALARLGRFAEAWPVQERVIGIAGAAATADDHADLAEYMILAASTYVSPEAEAALARALALDPAHEAARFYAGLAMEQAGRPEAAYDLWAGLLAGAPPGAPWAGAVRENLARVAARLGRPLPPGAATPPGADAAEAERIRGMVEGLAARLAAEGGPAADWARLVRALAVLGERARAAAILAEARETFAADPAGLALIEAEARAAGLAE